MSLYPCFLDLADAAYQRALDDVRDRLGRENVGFDRIVAVLPLLLALTVPDVSCCLLWNFKLSPCHSTYSLTMMNGLPDSSFITCARPLFVSRLFAGDS